MQSHVEFLEERILDVNVTFISLLLLDLGQIVKLIIIHIAFSIIKNLDVF